MTTLLAFDTATERFSMALSAGGKVWSREGEGGAKASATFLPALLALLDEAGVALPALDAIAFGRGPGAFTGLRTACSVAQGLALGANLPVLPIDTLLAVAEDAGGSVESTPVWAVMDARMDEIYAACYAHDGGAWRTREAPFLTSAETLNARWRRDPPAVVAGNALVAFGDRLVTGGASRVPEAVPRAIGMLVLAQAAWSRGEAVDAAEALPLYVRDKVAETTAERAARAAA